MINPKRRVLFWTMLGLGAWTLHAGPARRAGAQNLPALPEPVPATSRLATAQEELHHLYAAQFAKESPPDRAALAGVLMSQAQAILRDSAKDDSAARYVALSDAVDLAAAAGDAKLAVAAVDLLAAQFLVNGLELRRGAIVRAHAAASTVAQEQAVMALALETADRAAVVDAFDLVGPLCEVAETAANQTHDLKTVASIQQRLADLRSLAEEFKAVRSAFGKLEKDPGDGAAHLAIGRFYALHKGQWALGLAHLAAGSDVELQHLAAQELARPGDGLAQAQLGDAWWGYAEKADRIAQRYVQQHAAGLYKTARQNIQGDTLARIQSRISQAEGSSSSATAPAAAVAGAHVDLLALVDPDKDGAQGAWNKTAAGVTCESGSYSCLALPYVPPEEYDLRVRFTRIDGKGPVAILLAAGKHAFDFSLDIKGEARFERVNGKIAKDNPTTTPVAISNNHPYTLTLQIRKDRIAALLDDKSLVEYKTDGKDLSRYNLWKLKDESLCGVGANNAKVTFQSVEIIEITGKGKPTR